MFTCVNSNIMNFSVSNINFSMPVKRYYGNNTRQNITFSGHNNNEHKSDKTRKAATWLLGALMLAGCAKTCSNQPDSKYYYTDGIEVEFSNVSQLTKDSVMKPVYDMRNNLSSDNDFLKGTKFDIAYDFRDIEKNDSFKKYLSESMANPNLKGTSFYSDEKIRKQVAIQEISHTKSYPEMRQTLMHEVGHLFDNYFGHDHNAEYAKKWDSLMAKEDLPYDFETVTEEDKILDITYNYNNSLSDKPEFQKALLKDLKNIRRLYRRYEPMPYNISYFIKNFGEYGSLTPDVIDSENSARAEIYAQLFSYAAGEDDGEREKFVKCFPNCYEVVESDMEKYLGTKK